MKILKGDLSLLALRKICGYNFIASVGHCIQEELYEGDSWNDFLINMLVNKK